MLKSSKLIICILLFSFISLNAQNTTFSAAKLTGQSDNNNIKEGHFKSNKTLYDGKKKSPGKAFFLSLLLPGMGEYYVGEKKSAPYFLSAEILLWLGVFANESYYDHLVKDYKTYAVQHAAVDRSGKDVNFWTNIGKYDDIYSFNDQRERERYLSDVYTDTELNYWNWDSRENRYNYDKKRLDANSLGARVVYIQAAVMLNHMVSAIHAMYRARKLNKSLEQEAAWNLNFETAPLGMRDNWYKANFSFRF